MNNELKQHKIFFSKEKRGFGEEAFHTMWFLLYKKFEFKNFLEIGVYRGQVMSLISLLAKIENKEIEIYGISPFNKSGDTVSSYLDIDYIEDIHKNFAEFNLTKPTLVNSYSTDEKALDLIKSKIWECIYIDGSHDYEIVLQDWKICSQNIKIDGIIIMDDSSLYTNFQNLSFAFKGHPGPSKVSDEVAKESINFKEILRVGHNRVFQRVN
jgi:hypothetical protein